MEGLVPRILLRKLGSESHSEEVHDIGPVTSFDNLERHTHAIYGKLCVDHEFHFHFVGFEKNCHTKAIKKHLDNGIYFREDRVVDGTLQLLVHFREDRELPEKFKRRFAPPDAVAGGQRQKRQLTSPDPEETDQRQKKQKVVNPVENSGDAIKGTTEQDEDWCGADLDAKFDEDDTDAIQGPSDNKVKHRYQIPNTYYKVDYVIDKLPSNASAASWDRDLTHLIQHGVLPGEPIQDPQYADGSCVEYRREFAHARLIDGKYGIDAEVRCAYCETTNSQCRVYHPHMQTFLESMAYHQYFGHRCSNCRKSHSKGGLCTAHWSDKKAFQGMKFLS